MFVPRRPSRIDRFVFVVVDSGSGFPSEAVGLAQYERRLLHGVLPSGRATPTRYDPLAVSTPRLIGTIYLSIGSRKPASPQNRQLNILISNSKQGVDGFWGS